MKIFIVLALLAVFSALALAVYWMLGRSTDHATERSAEQPERARKMANALAWRVGLSIALIVMLLLGYALGWIQPQAAPLGK